MKNKVKIATILAVVAIGLAFSSTSGFAQAASQPAQQTYGPSSLDFNTSAWPGGQPARH